MGRKDSDADKVELNATLYLPKTPDGSPPETPVIFTLTPYISDTYHARAAYFASYGYAFALVDVRGRGNSGGEFEPFANDPRRWTRRRGMVGTAALLQRQSGDVGRLLCRVQSVGDGERISNASCNDRAGSRCASIARLPFSQQHRDDL